jgi:hypothetical protein
MPIPQQENDKNYGAGLLLYRSNCTLDPSFHCVPSWGCGHRHHNKGLHVMRVLALGVVL